MTETQNDPEPPDEVWNLIPEPPLRLRRAEEIAHGHAEQLAQDAAVPPPTARNGLGLSSVIVGLVGALFGLVQILGAVAILVGSVALALGVGGLYRARAKTATNGKVALLGSLLGLFALVSGAAGCSAFLNDVQDLEQRLEEISYEHQESTVQLQRQLRQTEIDQPVRGSER